MHRPKSSYRSPARAGACCRSERGHDGTPSDEQASRVTGEFHRDQRKPSSSMNCAIACSMRRCSTACASLSFPSRKNFMISPSTADRRAHGGRRGRHSCGELAPSPDGRRRGCEASVRGSSSRAMRLSQWPRSCGAIAVAAIARRANAASSSASMRHCSRDSTPTVTNTASSSRAPASRPHNVGS